MDICFRFRRRAWQVAPNRNLEIQRGSASSAIPAATTVMDRSLRTAWHVVLAIFSTRVLDSARNAMTSALNAMVLRILNAVSAGLVSCK